MIRQPSFWQLRQVNRLFALTFPRVTSAERTYALVRSRAVYVAHRRGRLFGFYVANYREDRRSLWLDYLGVEPPSRCQGVGGALIRHYCELGRRHRVEKLQLCVWSSNAVALHLYLKEGFTILEETIEPRSGDVKYILDKPLPRSAPGALACPTALVPYSLHTLPGVLHILGWRTTLSIPCRVSKPRSQDAPLTGAETPKKP
jgi:ribosomal protein S18 acetylase RimI-like enzyme